MTNKTKMKKIKCRLGIHEWEFVTWSEYAYNLDAWNQRVRKQAIKKCKCCGKLSKAPEWYKEEYRKMFPFVDRSGSYAKWQPEVEY